MEDVLGFLDMQTIIFTMVITNLVCTLVMLLLWRQNHKRLDGITFFVFDYTLQTLAILLIVLRGKIPDWISIDLSNTLSMIGMYLGYRGLEHFFHLKSVQWHNYALLLIYPFIFTWFTYVHPDLAVRDLMIGLFSFLFCFQCVWLLFFRVNRTMLRMTMLVGAVFIAYCAVDISRIFDYFMNQHHLINYFDAGSFEAFVILSYKMLLIVLTFGLALMFNKRLLDDIVVQEEKFSKAFHTSPYAILLTNMEDGHILEINETFHQYSGFSSEDIVGRTSIIINFWENSNDRTFVLDELAKGKEIRDMEFNFLRKNGSRLTGLFSAEIITVNGEKCLLSSINDISERKLAEEELKESEARFRELNATKDKFFSIIAHDLRSPFNSILGFSKLLEENVRSKEYSSVEEYASIIHKSTQHTLDLLMNLLEWSRSQIGRMEFTPEYLEFTILVKDIVGLFDDAARQKSITVSMEEFPNATVFADKALLSIILRNLISNAIKFTHPGGEIHLSARMQDQQLKVCVMDNGVGIKKEDLKKLFRMEESISKRGTQNEQGTGLGLLLCKEFVEKHGGKIWAESTIDKGSVFCFTLPTNL